MSPANTPPFPDPAGLSPSCIPERPSSCRLGPQRERSLRSGRSAACGFTLLLILLTLLIPIIGPKAPAAPGDPDWIYSSPDERRLVEEIQRLSQRGEYDQALPLAQEAIQRFPDSPQSNLFRIQLAQSMNRLEDVLPYYADRSLRNPKDGVARLCLGLCYLQVRNLEAAERELKAALALLPKRPEVRHFEILLARADPQKESKAESLARRFRQDFPDYGRALVTEAGHLLEREAPSRRVQAVLDAAYALPVPPPDAYQLQDELNQRKLWYDHGSGATLYDKALQIDPSRMDLRVNRSYRLMQLGRADEAVESLQDAIRESPRYGDARIALARMLIDLHRYEEALDVLEKGIGLCRHQEWYPPSAGRVRFDAFHLSGRETEAGEELQRLLRDYPNSPTAREARRLLISLLGRGPHDSVHILDNVPFLTQKGNYCGPATLSMALGYWGDTHTQDAIAADIYTGVVGTAPQVIREYARSHGFLTTTFEGDVDTWKRLLDAGIPVLWLTRAPNGAGHYILVTGYDDVFREFIVHNPHQSTERRVSYEDLKRSVTPLPNLTWSIALVPEGRPEAKALAGLKETFRLKVINLVFYIATGSNLFKGIWPALGVNLIVAGFLALLVLAIMSTMVYPGLGRSRWVFLLFALILVAALNQIIALARVSEAVSVLVGYYLACFSLIPLFVVCSTLRWISHDWFHPRELFALSAVVFGSWAIRGVIDDGYWQDRIPILLIAVGFVAMLAIRWRMARAIGRARLGPCGESSGPDSPGDSESLLRRFAGTHSNHAGFFSALLALVEVRIGNLDGTNARLLLASIRANRRRWPRLSALTFDLLEAACRVLESIRSPIPATTATGIAPSSSSSANCTEPKELEDSSHLSWREAVDTLERILRDSGPDTILGATASGFLAFAHVSADAQEPSDKPRESRERILQLIEQTNLYLGRRRSWPRLPAIPLTGFHAYPHLLVRLLPLILRYTQSRLSAFEPVLDGSTSTPPSPVAAPGQSAGPPSTPLHPSIAPLSTRAEQLFIRHRG